MNNHNLPSKRALDTIDQIVTAIVEDGGKAEVNLLELFFAKSN